jgi:hypothetical protein
VIEDPARDRHHPQVGIDRRGRDQAAAPLEAVVGRRRRDLGVDLIGDRGDLRIVDGAAAEQGEILEVAGAEAHALDLGVGHRAVEVEDQQFRWSRGRHLDR